MRYSSEDIEQWVAPARAFLGTPTPRAWVDWALVNQDLLLIDHANCERKAAVTAMMLMQRHLDDTRFMQQLSKLAREELVHFEQVMKLMRTLGVAYRPLSAAAYATGLLAEEARAEPWRRIDRLLISALIEARSCERFAALAPGLEEPVQGFYLGLLRSESRHFEIYRRKAEDLAGRRGLAGALDARCRFWVERENELICAPAEAFRFHSGVPSEALSPV